MIFLTIFFADVNFFSDNLFVNIVLHLLVLFDMIFLTCIIFFFADVNFFSVNFGNIFFAFIFKFYFLVLFRFCLTSQ